MSSVGCAIPGMQLLSEEHCRLIHSSSLEILRRTGVEVYGSEALKLLRQTGGALIRDHHVHLEPALVEWAVAQAPSRIVLCERSSDRPSARLEGREVVFGTGSDCLTYLDPRSGVRRPFTHADVEDCIRVVDALDELQFCMSMGIPRELGESLYRVQFAAMLRNTRKPIVFVCNDRTDCEAIVAMASAAAGGIASLRNSPSILLYSEPSSPLRHSRTAVEKLLYMAEQSLPVVHSPAPVQGGTAPVTLSGALAMANAEVLSGLVLHQLKRKGSPFVYGCGMHQLDMKTLVSVYTSPEFLLARAATAEMGRFYGLPTWGYAGDANSCVVDQQAASEATFSILTALLAGSNLTHDVGYLESGKTTSPEMMILCNEIITMARTFMRGISFEPEMLALDIIHEVGSHGNFLTSQHTLHHYRKLWMPDLFTRVDGETWTTRGTTMSESIRDRTLAVLEEHRPPELSQEADDEIKYILQASAEQARKPGCEGQKENHN